MHKSAPGCTREEIREQVMNKDPAIGDFAGYVPIANAVKKIQNWAGCDNKIYYLTSRRNLEEIEAIRSVLVRNHFPVGQLESCGEGEKYCDVVTRVMPDILVEDDCSSIGGESEMAFTYLQPDVKARIKHFAVKEFLGIEALPDDFRNGAKAVVEDITSES